MSTYNITVLPGDGVGPEVVAEAMKVLLALEEPHPNLRFVFSEHPVGAACYQETGEDLPESTLQACRQSDAILFGSAGDPAIRFPDGTEIAPQLTLRFVLDLYAGIRPIKKYPGVPPLLSADPPIDYVILRENTEGLYASRGAGVRVGDEVAVVESVKSASDIYAPVGGVITKVNAALQDDPTLVNNSSYVDGWLFQLRVTDSSEIEKLMDAAAYSETVGE